MPLLRLLARGFTLSGELPRFFDSSFLVGGGNALDCETKVEAPGAFLMVVTSGGFFMTLAVPSGFRSGKSGEFKEAGSIIKAFSSSLLSESDSSPEELSSEEDPLWVVLAVDVDKLIFILIPFGASSVPLLLAVVTLVTTALGFLLFSPSNSSSEDSSSDEEPEES